MTPLLLAVYAGLLGDAAALLRPRIGGEIANSLSSMESGLADREFLVGDDLTGADILALFVPEATGERLAPYPGLTAHRFAQHAGAPPDAATGGAGWRAGPRAAPASRGQPTRARRCRFHGASCFAAPRGACPLNASPRGMWHPLGHASLGRGTVATRRATDTASQPASHSGHRGRCLLYTSPSPRDS